MMKEIDNVVIRLHRYTQDENQTNGVVTVIINNEPVFSCVSLERGWQGNQRNVSCVPKRNYPLKLEYSPRFKTKLWELKNVPNRSETKFHSANYWHQLNGCISLGLLSKDINRDNYKDTIRSKIAMDLFHTVLKYHKQATLFITAEPEIK